MAQSSLAILERVLFQFERMSAIAFVMNVIGREILLATPRRVWVELDASADLQLRYTWFDHVPTDGLVIRRSHDADSPLLITSAWRQVVKGL